MGFSIRGVARPSRIRTAVAVAGLGPTKQHKCHKASGNRGGEKLNRNDGPRAPPKGTCFCRLRGVGPRHGYAPLRPPGPKARAPACMLHIPWSCASYGSCGADVFIALQSGPSPERALLAMTVPATIAPPIRAPLMKAPATTCCAKPSVFSFTMVDMIIVFPKNCLSCKN